MSKVQERNRLTCVLNLYHEQEGEQPEGIRLSFSESLSLNAQRYNRRLKIGTDPVPFDMGWFKTDEIGPILIENLEGRHFRIHPSDEEREDIELRVLKVYYPGSPGWLIPPRRFFLAFPEDVNGLTLQSTHGTIKTNIIIIPR